MGTAEMDVVRDSAGSTESRMWLRELGRAWYRGWIGFAAASGGRAEDLVGGNPWHALIRNGGGDAER